MAESLSQLLLHLEALPLEHPARATIVESWERCAAARIARDGAVEFRQVDGFELTRRLRQSAALVRVARPLLEQLVEELPGSTNVAYLTDADGIVLDSVGPAAQLREWGLLPGFDWSEETMGTNGAGTCLVVRRPVVVAGPEHFMDVFDDCTCTAAPIRGPARTLVGALDVSSRVMDAGADRIQLVAVAAEQIGQRLQGEAL